MADPVKKYSPNRLNLLDTDRQLDAISRELGGPGSSFRRATEEGHSFLIDTSKYSDRLDVSPSAIADRLAEACGCRVKVVGFDPLSKTVTGWLDVDNWNLDERDVPFPQEPSVFDNLPGVLATPEHRLKPIVPLGEIRSLAMARLAENNQKALDRKAKKEALASVARSRVRRSPSAGVVTQGKMTASGLAAAQYAMRKPTAAELPIAPLKTMGGGRGAHSEKSHPTTARGGEDRAAAAELATKLQDRRFQAETVAAGILASAKESQRALTTAVAEGLLSEPGVGSDGWLLKKLAERRKDEGRNGNAPLSSPASSSSEDCSSSSTSSSYSSGSYF